MSNTSLMITRKGDGIIVNEYKVFTHQEAKKWGMTNYGNWLIDLQNQDYNPCTPSEEFF